MGEYLKVGEYLRAGEYLRVGEYLRAGEYLSVNAKKLSPEKWLFKITEKSAQKILKSQL